MSPAMLRRSRELADERGVGYTIHLSQSKQEVAGVMAAWGVLPTHYLEQNEFLGPRLVVALCREIVESEIQALGRHGTGISNNPAIAARRGAAAPALDLEEAGCQIGIGTGQYGRGHGGGDPHGLLRGACTPRRPIQSNCGRSCWSGEQSAARASWAWMRRLAHWKSASRLISSWRICGGRIWCPSCGWCLTSSTTDRRLTWSQ